MSVIKPIQEQEGLKTYRRGSPSYNLPIFSTSFRRLLNHIVATLQMIEMDMKIDGNFDSPIVDIDISTIKEHLDTEIVIAVTVLNRSPKPKEQEKVFVFQGLRDAVTAAKYRDRIIEIEEILKEMDAIEHEYSSGRLWWGLLKDWLLQQQAITAETAEEKLCATCGHSESRHQTAGGFCKHCPCEKFVEEMPL